MTRVAEEELLALLGGSDAERAGDACDQLHQVGSRQIVSRVISLLEGECAVPPMELAKLLESRVRGSNARAITGLLRRHHDVGVRHAAAYLLGTMAIKSSALGSVGAALGERACCELESDAVRATALESLGQLMQWQDRRRAAYRHASAVVVDALRSASAEVRFWGCFAAGTMRCRAALPELHRLAESGVAVVPGWWGVADEASDALGVLAGQPWPGRVRDSGGS